MTRIGSAIIVMLASVSTLGAGQWASQGALDELERFRAAHKSHGRKVSVDRRHADGGVTKAIRCSRDGQSIARTFGSADVWYVANGKAYTFRDAPRGPKAWFGIVVAPNAAAAVEEYKTWPEREQVERKLQAMP